MKLASSRLCLECGEIFDHIRTLSAGTGDAKVCPACTKKSTVLLASWIETMKNYSKNCCLCEAGR